MGTFMSASGHFFMSADSNFSVIESGQLTGIDQLLFVPTVDRLSAGARSAATWATGLPEAAKSGTLRRNPRA
jgi:hypothetical protein